MRFGASALVLVGLASCVRPEPIQVEGNARAQTVLFVVGEDGDRVVHADRTLEGGTVPSWQFDLARNESIAVVLLEPSLEELQLEARVSYEPPFARPPPEVIAAYDGRVTEETLVFERDVQLDIAMENLLPALDLQQCADADRCIGGPSLGVCTTCRDRTDILDAIVPTAMPDPPNSAFECTPGFVARADRPGCSPVLPDDCASNELPIPGGCIEVSSACPPPGEWADADPNTTPIYVQAGATNGSGSMGAPYGTLAEALTAATNDNTILLTEGRYVGTPIDTPVRIVGACATETIITSPLRILTASVSIADVGFVASMPPLQLARASELDLDRVIIESDVDGIIVEGRLTGRNVAIRRAVIGILVRETGTAALSGLHVNAAVFGARSEAGTALYERAVFDVPRASHTLGVESLGGGETNLTQFVVRGGLHAIAGGRFTARGGWVTSVREAVRVADRSSRGVLFDVTIVPEGRVALAAGRSEIVARGVAIDAIDLPPLDQASASVLVEHADADLHEIEVAVRETTHDGMIITGSSSVSLEDVLVRSESPSEEDFTPASGINIPSQGRPGDARLNRVRIEGAWRNGLIVRGAHDLEIENLQVQNTWGLGLDLTDSTASITRASIASGSTNPTFKIDGTETEITGSSITVGGTGGEAIFLDDGWLELDAVTIDTRSDVGIAIGGKRGAALTDLRVLGSTIFGVRVEHQAKARIDRFFIDTGFTAGVHLDGEVATLNMSNGVIEGESGFCLSRSATAEQLNVTQTMITVRGEVFTKDCTGTR